MSTKQVISRAYGPARWVRALVLTIWCPACGRYHVDREEWAVTAHHTHLCEHCGHVWTPFSVFSIGVPPETFADVVLEARKVIARGLSALVRKAAKRLGVG